MDAVKDTLALLAVTVVAGFVAHGIDPRPQVRLVVTFGSVCCGPDRAAMEAFDRHLKDLDAKYGRRTSYTRLKWGDEGETTYCFDFNDVSAADRDKFIARLRALNLRGSSNNEPGGRGWTDIVENGPCAGIGDIDSVERSY